ncbi:glycoside hydrolase family 95 protein [Marinilabiliaceae bacterium ANBcel2]|nr:glycoside hydrolase family 95 protein [Marinilabiliaceae bacterium ANBcel2]
MQNLPLKFTFIIVLLLLFFNGCTRESAPEYRIWFDNYAVEWEETLPLGNGHIGFMPDGNVETENIVFNNITLWSGGEQDPNNPEAAQYLPRIQQLLFEGRNDEAQELVYENFVCKGAGSNFGAGHEAPYGSFEILGNITFDFDYDMPGEVDNYYRELNLDEAVAKTSFNRGGIHYEREYFTSFSDDVGVIRLSADRRESVSLKISLDRPRAFETTIENSAIVMRGQLTDGVDGNGMRYKAKIVPVLKGGKLTIEDNSLVVDSADEVLLLVASATDYAFNDYSEYVSSVIKEVEEKSYFDLRGDHVKEYQKYFNRVSIDLKGMEETNLLPVNERLLQFAESKNDNKLVELYFQYGRYLLISSAHAQILPPNLQGLWANTIDTPWNGDYHLNINVQMNHWPCEITNLTEMHRPLIDLTKGLVEPGKKTASVFYNSDGWVAHMMTNVWGYTAPGEHPSWGATNTGCAWLTAHLWEHYDFSKDVDYLRDVYPVFKGAARFFLDMLVRDPNTGWLVTAPTTSPENSFFMPDSDEVVSICMGSTMDNQLIRELFTNTIEAAEILNIDSSFAAELAEAVEDLPPNRIGSDGRLMEWLQEYREAEPQHRHVSHLYGLHPGNEITPHLTPDLANAARETLYARGDGGTGWSMAWKVNFWARLHDGNHAYKLLVNLLDPVFDGEMNLLNKGGTYPNLFCAHPPFQIDGNFGGTAGIAEMLVQSHAGFINFIPALPDQFSKGSFEGLRVRGEGEVSARWRDKKLEKASLEAGLDHTYTILIPGYAKEALVTVNGSNVELDIENGLFSVDLKEGDRLEITI